MTLVQDIALFTTKETVDHIFALAPTSAGQGERGLRAMGHPEGLPFVRGNSDAVGHRRGLLNEDERHPRGSPNHRELLYRGWNP